MTVKELKELLNKYSDEMDVVVKSGNSGNVVPTSSNWQPSSKTVALSEQYKSLAVSVENNFRTYMEDSTLPEWSYTKKSEESTNFNDFY